MLVELCYRVVAIGRLRHENHIGFGTNDHAEALANDRMILHDEDTHCLRLSHLKPFQAPFGQALRLNDACLSKHTTGILRQSQTLPPIRPKSFANSDGLESLASSSPISH